eukprot:1783648-Prymnesium_polylepis.1
MHRVPQKRGPVRQDFWRTVFVNCVRGVTCLRGERICSRPTQTRRRFRGRFCVSPHGLTPRAPFRSLHLQCPRG